MLAALFAFALAALQANALLRFPCSQFTVTRSDPLINPNTVGAHLHQVVGGNKFDFSMPMGSVDPATATCSSCQFKDNKSNYWTPTMYFQSPVNGTFKRVRQLPGPLTGSPNGGMVVYYNQIGQVTSFPQNFRMIAGDPMLRSYDSKIDDSRSITFRCLQSANDINGAGPDTNGMPATNCPGGVRTQLNFPTCWDGKNVDTANHKDHMKYAIGASFGNFGQGCPSTHPVNVPMIYLETYWDTAPFAKEWQNGKSPFVWSMGDPTGYGYHADYMMGWPEATLRTAMAQCNDFGGACSVLATRTEQEMNDCAVANRVDEDLDGWLTALPGCNPVQAGPGRATPVSGCGAPTQMLPVNGVSFLKTGISGWTPVGCASETGSEQLLNGARQTMAGMTIESCLNFCNGRGMAFAGMKNRNQCSCGASLNTSKVSSSYACNLACEGDLNEFCGAANRVAVYSGKGPVDVPTQTVVPPSDPTNTVTPPPPSGGTVPKWGQCGGEGYSGPTQCESGSTCQYSNPWYSQCL